VQATPYSLIQLIPPGSGCSITLISNSERERAVQGLQLVLADVEAARAWLVEGYGNQ
jgi:hypothetical protein